jgi:hypothetical protein
MYILASPYATLTASINNNNASRMISSDETQIAADVVTTRRRTISGRDDALFCLRKELTKTRGSSVAQRTSCFLSAGEISIF